MPSQRKRIGFLPSTEVQSIIDKISAKENISQSKVTGILVEEALRARLVESNKKEYVPGKESITDKNVESYFSNFITNNSNNDDLSNVEFIKSSEYRLVKEYVEYKLFKKMLKNAISDRKV